MGDPTSRDTVVVSRDLGSADPATASLAVKELARSDRYRIAGTLAEGGMGEVLVAQDVPLARDVVVKRMRTSSPSAESVRRFLREARIQGRLQHPAIVPVHDLAVDADGRPFFAMKHITGTTLADILARSKVGFALAMSRPQLLRAFIDVCLAIELAHTRGVVHRDLKPGNIALGDFGEVYVLDWGVARLVNDPDSNDDSMIDTDWQVVEEAVPGATLPGSILGTPGYMAPEQLHSAKVDAAADIYSLGCILFEILALEPLHPRNGPMASTVVGADARPSQRAPHRDVSPELDAICVCATARSPADRYPSARALAKAVERYLDGDRDVARRNELAEEHLSEARAALAQGSAEQRSIAFRAAGRALALDPGSTDAAELVSHLVLSTPTTMPPELLVELDDNRAREARTHSVVAALGLSTFILFFPVLLWIGIRDWQFIAIAFSLVVLSVAYTLNSGRMPKPPAHRAWIGMLASAVLIATFSRLFGPFLLPAGIATVAMAICANHPHLMKHPWVLFVVFVVAALGPWGLEVVGVLAPTYTVTPEGYLLTSHVLAIQPFAGEIAIATFIFMVVVVIGLLSLRVARLNRDIRVRLEIQAWHLRQLVPAAREAASVTSTTA